MSYFDDHWGDGWPDLAGLEACLTNPDRRLRYFKRHRDGGGSFFIEGLYGTENLDPQRGQVEASLYMDMHPDYGVKLQYSKWDGRIQQVATFHSKGDLSRLKKFFRTGHGTPLSLGLFIPFEPGWKAVREFIERDGELPTAIAWISSKDLSPDVFPLP